MMIVGARSLHSRSYANKYKKRTKFFLVMGVVIMLLVLGATWWITDRSPLVIEHLEISGAVMTQSALIEERVQSLLQSRFFLWSRNNTLLVPRSRIVETLETEFQWIKDARVTRGGLSLLHIEIEEYEPLYTVCDTDTENCFVADERGHIFAPATADNRMYMRWTYTLPDEVIGTRITSRTEFTAFSDFISALEDNGLVVRNVIISDTNEVRFVLSQGTHIVVNRKGNWEHMLGNFLLLLAEQTNVFSTRDAFLRSTEYIDVRHGNKIFYKAYDTTVTIHGE